MVTQTPQATPSLAEVDETAWLEQTAEQIRDGRFDQIDAVALSEYLDDMARRDRREVESRLVVLLAHLLKWEYQSERRSGSWLSTILEQQRQLEQCLESGTLRNHAVAALAKAFAYARKQAAAETGLSREAFPVESPWDLDGILADRGEAV